MPFEEYANRTVKLDPIPEGHASVDRGGNLNIRRSDLDLIGIENCAVVLVDETTLRLGLKKPRPGQHGVMRVAPVYRSKKKTPTGWCRIRVGGALSSIRLDPESAAGRYELTVHHDSILILNLAGIEERAGEN